MQVLENNLCTCIIYIVLLKKSRTMQEVRYGKKYNYP